MRIVFHGSNAAAFSDGFAELLDGAAQIDLLPDPLTSAAERAIYAAADVIVGGRFDASLPRPEALRLFQVPGAGYDAVNLALLPPQAVVCNCFGHEAPIAEYVMAALLRTHIPLEDADNGLRQGEWRYSASSAVRAHGEIFGSTLGILGFGHIGKAVAQRAKPFGIRVQVANRSAVAPSESVDRYFPLSALAEFWGSADSFVVTVPLTEETRGMVDAAAFAAMRPHAILVNVARGPVVDEAAFYEALRDRRIGGAVIDTWYRYPTAAEPNTLPATLPFQNLPNVLMTPHMSGWTTGTIRRRQAVIAENIRRRMRGAACENVVHGG